MLSLFTVFVGAQFVAPVLDALCCRDRSEAFAKETLV